MEFEIKRVMTAEYSFDFLKIDLNHLEDFIADRINNADYGDSVIKYFWGFDLFKYDGGFTNFYKNDIESWKHSLKWLVISTRFDWNVIKELNAKDTFELLKITFLK